MTLRDPEKNFEALWLTFHNRYPFFALRDVDWTKQYRHIQTEGHKRRPPMMSCSRSSAGCLPR